MKLAVIKETAKGEARVALVPSLVKKYQGLGFSVAVQEGAGEAAGFMDSAYKDAGAELGKTFAATVKGAGVALKVQGFTAKELAGLDAGTVAVANFGAPLPAGISEAAKKADVAAFALELMPRISRAQSMDILSSQSNLAGYRAVVDAFYISGKVVPMMMTAAGTVTAAKVLIMGVGVAGLQAIATARRMGAVVSAFDIRPETKEQVESLGAKFIEGEALAAGLAAADIVITTAMVMGRKAPVLIKDDALKTMKAGAVIIDMAAESGGNVEGSFFTETVEKYGVKIVGAAGLASEVAGDASALLARNYFNFILPMVRDGEIHIPADDEIYKATAIS